MLYSLQREHLKKWKFSAESKQLFSEDKFSKEENTIKFCRLIDFSSNDQFDEKLKSLKSFWYARDLAVSEKPTSHEWFITGKVDSFTYGFYPVVSIPNTGCFSRWWLLLGARKSAPKKLKNNFSKISYIFKDSCTLLNCFYILSNLKSN